MSGRENRKRAVDLLGVERQRRKENKEGEDEEMECLVCSFAPALSIALQLLLVELLAGLYLQT